VPLLRGVSGETQAIVKMVFQHSFRCNCPAVHRAVCLSLVWFNPRYKVITKAVVTILVIIFTFLLGYMAILIYSRFLDSIRELGIH
jgi:hypothetical protein